MKTEVDEEKEKEKISMKVQEFKFSSDLIW
jgi:hypothetical protein